MKYSLDISNFLGEILTFQFYYFLLLLCFCHWRRPYYLSWYSLEFCIQLGIFFPFFPCLSLLFFPQIFVKPPQTATLPSCTFFFLGMVLVTASCTVLGTSVHNSSDTLFTRSNPLSLRHLHCLIPEWPSGFIYFLNLSLNFAITCWWSEPQSTPNLVLDDCIEFFHLWLQRI